MDIRAIYRKALETAIKQNMHPVLAQAAERNAVVACKVCGNGVAELATSCPTCGEMLPGLRIKCSNCHSIHITIQKKGFGLGKAVVGDLLVGPIGLIGGSIGSKDTQYVCLSCGNKWNSDQMKNMEVEQAPLVKNK